MQELREGFTERIGTYKKQDTFCKNYEGVVTERIGMYRNKIHVARIAGRLSQNVQERIEIRCSLQELREGCHGTYRNV